MKNPKLLLIDGQGLAYRAFYALPPLKTSKEQPVNAVYGFTNMLLKIIELEKPQYVAAAFDKGIPYERLKKYPEYKIQRQKQPEDLTFQLPLIEKILRALQIPIYWKEGYEADDCLATLAKTGEEKFKILILTGDLDFLQLVNPRINILMLKKGISDLILYNQEKIKERFNLEPQQLIDYKALRGDPSDNIKGVPGIGEAQAIKLLNQFENLEEIFKNLDKLPLKQKELLKEYKEQAFLSKNLVTLKTDLELNLSWEDCLLRPPMENEWRKILENLEFKSLLKKIAPGAQTNFLITEEADFQEINLNSFESMEEKIKKEKNISILGIVKENKFLSLAISIESENFYLKKIDKEFLKKLKPLLEAPEILKIGFSLKSLISFLKEIEINLVNIFDLSIASYLINPERSPKLSTMISFYLNLNLENIEEAIKNNQTEKIPHLAANYAGNILRLYPALLKELEKYNLINLYFNLELPLIFILADMEISGIKIDGEYLNELSKNLEEKLKNLQKKIFSLSGQELNLNSPKQVGEILFEKLKLQGGKTTKTGYSTDAHTLSGLAFSYPICEKILEHRELVKLKSTYADVLPKLINPQTRRLHTSFNQTITSTGRLSSSNPNLQNIPIKTEMGKLIRRAFIPEEGNILLSADYSQIELRILAHFSGDFNLIQAFIEDQDIHAKTARAIFSLKEEKEVAEIERRKAKEINFGINYGMSEYGLAESLKITKAQAKAYIEEYFRYYPGVKKFMEDLIRDAEKNQAVYTLLGRRREIPEINSRNFTIRKLAQRIAINTPIQGSAADLIKLAMLALGKIFKKEENVKLLLQIHDELIFEMPKNKLEETQKIVKEVMQKVYPLKVPLKVNLASGFNWGEI
ncbi:MAG: DNA polymerase I [Armatimonadetes bacterium]|nr:DNA polymerase I [Armatimonadota bacterium]